MHFARSCLAFALAVPFSALASPSPAPTVDVVARAVPTQGVGPDGYFYSSWTDTPGLIDFINESNGTYTLDWRGYGLVGAGKGWNPGGNDRLIRYNATYQPDGDSVFGVYGWTRNPLVEYYIVDSFSTLTPSAGAIRKGSVTCNGAKYTVSAITRYNQPSIDGTQIFQQYWSVRDNRKLPGGEISGEIDVGCHFAEWKALSMDLGSEHNYQLLMLQASYSTGHFRVTLS